MTRGAAFLVCPAAMADRAPPAGDRWAALAEQELLDIQTAADLFRTGQSARGDALLLQRGNLSVYSLGQPVSAAAPLLHPPVAGWNASTPLPTGTPAAQPRHDAQPHRDNLTSGGGAATSSRGVSHGAASSGTSTRYTQSTSPSSSAASASSASASSSTARQSRPPRPPPALRRERERASAVELKWKAIRPPLLAARMGSAVPLYCSASAPVQPASSVPCLTAGKDGASCCERGKLVSCTTCRTLSCGACDALAHAGESVLHHKRSFRGVELHPGVYVDDATQTAHEWGVQIDYHPWWACACGCAQYACEFAALNDPSVVVMTGITPVGRVLLRLPSRVTCLRCAAPATSCVGVPAAPRAAARGGAGGRVALVAARPLDWCGANWFVGSPSRPSVLYSTALLEQLRAVATIRINTGVEAMVHMIEEMYKQSAGEGWRGSSISKAPDRHAMAAVLREYCYLSQEVGRLQGDQPMVCAICVLRPDVMSVDACLKNSHYLHAAEDGIGEDQAYYTSCILPAHIRESHQRTFPAPVTEGRASKQAVNATRQAAAGSGGGAALPWAGGGGEGEEEEAWSGSEDGAARPPQQQRAQHDGNVCNIRNMSDAHQRQPSAASGGQTKHYYGVEGCACRHGCAYSMTPLDGPENSADASVHIAHVVAALEAWIVIMDNACSYYEKWKERHLRQAHAAAERAAAEGEGCAWDGMRVSFCLIVIFASFLLSAGVHYTNFFPSLSLSLFFFFFFF